MTQRRLTFWVFVLEGMNSFTTVYYLYYLYFFTQKTFGFDAKSNLMLAALSGAVGVVGSIYGGRFAQKQGCFKALKLGFVLMIVALGAGSQLTFAAGQVGAMCVMVAGMSFTWPSLEALASESQPPHRLPKVIGIYNVVWAATSALAYFTGG